MPRLIGLTGGIATGKSTVARLLALHGATVVDADVLAREVVEPGQPALEEIAAEFGSQVIDASGRLDRATVASVVFADPDRRRRLEAITHPRIQELMGRLLASALESGAPLVVADVPLLFENGRAAMFDGVMVAWCDAATELERLMARDGLRREDAERRLAAQMPVDEKRRLATWVIDNSGSEEATANQVDAWWKAHIV
jgi:dephospho-CoA kinase